LPTARWCYGLLQSDLHLRRRTQVHGRCEVPPASTADHRSDLPGRRRHRRFDAGLKGPGFNFIRWATADPPRQAVCRAVARQQVQALSTTSEHRAFHRAARRPIPGGGSARAVARAFQRFTSLPVCVGFGNRTPRGGRQAIAEARQRRRCWVPAMVDGLARQASMERAAQPRKTESAAVADLAAHCARSGRGAKNRAGNRGDISGQDSPKWTAAAGPTPAAAHISKWSMA